MSSREEREGSGAAWHHLNFKTNNVHFTDIQNTDIFKKILKYFSLQNSLTLPLITTSLVTEADIET